MDRGNLPDMERVTVIKVVPTSRLPNVEKDIRFVMSRVSGISRTTLSNSSNYLHSQEYPQRINSV